MLLHMLHLVIAYCVQNWLQIVQTHCSLIDTIITIINQHHATKNTSRTRKLRNRKGKRKTASYPKLSLTVRLDIHIIR